MNLNSEPKVIALANSLDLDLERPADAIRELCHSKVAKFLRRVGRITNIRQLQQVICKRLNLAVHEVATDEQLEELANAYMRQGEIGAGGAIKSQLTQDAFGVLIRLSARTESKAPRFVAVIDCRGNKHLRKVFTLWHEIAHCLTAVDQYSLPLRRTTAEMLQRDPVERLTDVIAADFAFYGPLFAPLVNSEISSVGRLTFRVVERVRERFNPDASFTSTLNACVAQASRPAILLEAGLAYKKAERDMIERDPSARKRLKPSLRVLASKQNEPAKEVIPYVPQNLRVPKNSSISRVFENDDSVMFETEKQPENLADWTTSVGDRLPPSEIHVEARKSGDRVIVLITPWI
jgi:hypothetical protein